MNRTLGILGGGQLGRMLALAARPLGLRVVTLDPNPDAPAQVAASHIHTPFDDPDGVKQLSESDFITFEFENIPDAVVRQLNETKTVNPPADALRVAQDRWIEKNAFLELGIPTPQFRKVDSLEDAKAAFDELGPIVLKTRRFGYDGKGQAVIRKADELPGGYASLEGAPAIAEELVPFDREMSIIVCRGLTKGADGKNEIAIYCLTENEHVGGILRTSRAPAPALSNDLVEQAQEAVTKLVTHFDYVGVLALELFQVGGKLVANEFAPRVHNSGHWTIEGALTSQFENHVRAVCGLPLGSAEIRCPSVMTNLIGAIPNHADVLSIADTHLHDYGKAPRAARKVGHVTSLGATEEEAEARATRVRKLFQ